MKKGFTMIELIFVIVILGVLAAVAIPKLNATRDDAEQAKAMTNLATLMGDLTSYYTAQGTFAKKISTMTNVPLMNDTGEVERITNDAAEKKVFSKKQENNKVVNASEASNGITYETYTKCKEKNLTDQDFVTEPDTSKSESKTSGLCYKSDFEKISSLKSEIKTLVDGIATSADFAIKNKICLHVQIASGVITSTHKDKTGLCDKVVKASAKILGEQTGDDYTIKASGDGVKF